MKIKSRKNKPTTVYPIGVDIGTSRLKLAQVRWAEGQFELLAAAAHPLSGNGQADGAAYFGQLTEALRIAIKAGGFKNRQCIISLPARETFLRHTKLSNTPPAQVGEAVRREVQAKLPYPIEEAVVRHVIAGEIYDDGDAKQEVIVVAAHRPTVERYVSAASKAKLDVRGVDIEACALVECFGRLFQRAADASRTTLFLDMGAASTQVVMAHGNKIVFAHNLKQGADQFDRTVADDLKVSLDRARDLRAQMNSKSMAVEMSPDRLYGLLQTPMEAMCEELTQCLRYYESAFPNRTVERVIFVGGQAYDKRLCQTIAQRLNLPAQVGDPLLRFRFREGVGTSLDLKHGEPAPTLAVAIGLSLGGERAA